METMRLVPRHLLMILVASVLLPILGCDLGSREDIANKPQLRQNKIVEELYGPLVGTYRCEITNTKNGRDEIARLVIMITSTVITNPDGTPGTRKIPLAVFFRISPVVASYRLTPTGYLKETGELSLAAQVDKENPDASEFAIIGKMDGKHYTAVVQSESLGQIGNLDCLWYTRKTQVDDSSTDRLLKAYRAVAGLYSGKVIHPTDAKKNFPVNIELTAQQDPKGIPYLSGFYDRLDMDDGWGDLALTVGYLPSENPPRIAMEGQGVLNYKINMAGTLENDEIYVDVNTKKDGYIGKLRAKLKKKIDPEPGDFYNDYLAAEGTYAGVLKIKVGKKTNKVTFTLVFNASRFDGKPILSAKLTRSDKSKDGGTVATVEFDPEVNKQAFRVRLDAGDGEVNDLDGTFDKSSITAKISTASEGNLGTLKLKKTAD